MKGSSKSGRTKFAIDVLRSARKEKSVRAIGELLSDTRGSIREEPYQAQREHEYWSPAGTAVSALHAMNLEDLLRPPPFFRRAVSVTTHAYSCALPDTPSLNDRVDCLDEVGTDGDPVGSSFMEPTTILTRMRMRHQGDPGHPAGIAPPTTGSPSAPEQQIDSRYGIDSDLLGVPGKGLSTFPEKDCGIEYSAEAGNPPDLLAAEDAAQRVLRFAQEEDAGAFGDGVGHGLPAEGIPAVGEDVIDAAVKGFGDFRATGNIHFGDPEGIEGRLAVELDSTVTATVDGSVKIVAHGRAVGPFAGRSERKSLMPHFAHPFRKSATHVAAATFFADSDGGFHPAFRPRFACFSFAFRRLEFRLIPALA